MKKRFLSLLAVLALSAALCIPAAAASALPFNDVPGNYWAYKTILYSYQSNLVKGKTATSFQPESPMTIGQYLTVLYRIGSQLNAGYPTEATTGSHWLDAANYLCKLYGMSLTENQMNYPISREQMAYFGARMVSSVCTASGATAKVVRSGSFSDSAKFTSAYKESVVWFYSIGGIGGYADGTFRPQTTLTRSQGVTVFYNIFNVIIPNLQKA